MNPALLEHYERELRHLREMGAEFAHEFPKVAGRLSLEDIECADPYVERLLEGFAFCTARIQHKLSSSFPRFTEALLNTLNPNYLAQMPSMAVVEMQPDFTESSLVDGYVVERGSELRGLMGDQDQTACEFRTSRDCTLWPLTMSEAKYYPNNGAVAAAGYSNDRSVRAAIRLTIESHPTVPLSELSLDHLSLYLRGDGVLPHKIYRQLHGDCVGVVAREAGYGAGSAQLKLPPECIGRSGFEADEALLPVESRAFDGYRRLQEYFAFPARFLFAEVRGLNPAVRKTTGHKLEVVFLLNRADPELTEILDADQFVLHATPAVNLFARRADRINLNAQDFEYHVVVDRTRPLDFEVYSIKSVKGFEDPGQPPKRFQPLYAPRREAGGRTEQAFFSTKREPRLLSSKGRRLGPRSSYLGSELFVSLVDVNEAPVSHNLKQLEVEVMCTNRDLPIEMPVGQSTTDFTLQSGAPVEAIRCLAGPTRPRPAPAKSELNWQLISQLSLNYLSLVEKDGANGAAGLKDLLTVFADTTDPVIARQIQGLGSIKTAPIHRRLPGPGPVVFGRGIQINVQLYDEAFAGGGAFLFGAVLACFFTRYTSINSFVEVTISTENSGVLRRWPSTPGLRHVL